MPSTMLPATVGRNCHYEQDDRTTLAQDASRTPGQDSTGDAFRTLRPCAELNFDDIGDTWPRAAEVERGAHYDEIDPRGFVP